MQQWSEEQSGLEDSIVIKRVKELREQMPRIGTRKLYHMLTETLQKHNIDMGRDKLFDLLVGYGLLVRRRKRKRVCTTDSSHPFRKYPNMIREIKVLRPNQLWVSDITYISLTDGFCYLSLITDAYSRKIVGYCLHPTLKAEGPVKALQMALGSQPVTQGAALIHHSDRGLQYCCSEYIQLLESRAVSISMTEKGDPYENAIAERVNGILKEEFALDKSFETLEQAAAAVDNAVATYNHQRPHASCDYLTPEVAHRQSGQLKQRWKSKKQKNINEEIILQYEQN